MVPAIFVVHLLNRCILCTWQMKQKERNINMEMLRVVAMFLIVVGHYMWMAVKNVMDPSILNVKSLMGGINYVTMDLLFLMASIGVDCFVMITGYFMIDNTEMRWRGVLKTWVQTLFYAVVIFAIGVVAFGQPTTTEHVLAAFFPIHQETYWFATHYIGLLFLAPFLARLASLLTQRQYQWLLCVTFVFSFTYFYGTVYMRDMHMELFVFIFFVAGYIRKYSVPEWWRRHTGWVVLAVWALLFVAGTGVNVMRYLKTGNADFKPYATDNNGPVFFLALSVFVWFVYHKPFSNRLVKMTAHLGIYTFGVYLIHQHFFINAPLWAFAANTYTMSVPLVCHCLFWTTLVFLVCVFLDMLRSLLFRFLHIDSMLDSLARKLPKL